LFSRSTVPVADWVLPRFMGSALFDIDMYKFSNSNFRRFYRGVKKV
jgi:hypothetical protein